MGAESPEKAKGRNPGESGGDKGVLCVLVMEPCSDEQSKAKSVKCPYKHNLVIFYASRSKYPFDSK